MNYVVGFILLIIGIIAGLKFPDLDLRLNFLVHRSIITHSFFIPLILFLWVRKKPQSSSYLLSIGFSLALVIHLCFDLFPRAWVGFALISVPVYGRMSPLFSWLWIAATLIVCLYLVLLLMRTVGDILLIFSSMLATFIIYAATESVVLPAFIALAVAMIIALMLPSDSSTIFKGIIRQKRRLDR